MKEKKIDKFVIKRLKEIFIRFGPQKEKFPFAVVVVDIIS
jgi:hypothetical protein